MMSLCDGTYPEKELCVFLHWPAPSSTSIQGDEPCVLRALYPRPQGQFCFSLASISPLFLTTEMLDIFWAPNDNLRKCVPGPEKGKK